MLAVRVKIATEKQSRSAKWCFCKPPALGKRAAGFCLAKIIGLEEEDYKVALACQWEMDY
jgi:hypothetical protein